MIEVSVILLNYNTSKLTCACLESIFVVTKDIRFEVILVDNGSTECDPALFKERFPDILLLVSPLNLGFAKGNNMGIQHSKGEYILLLNSDTLLTENVLYSSYHKLKHTTSIAALTIQLRYPNGKTQSNCQRFPSIKLELIELFRIQKLMSKEERSKLFLGSFFNHLVEMEADWVWGTFFLFRRDLLDNFPLKKLSEDFFLYGEDLQWCYEIKTRTPKKILFWPGTFVTHHVSSSSEKLPSFNKMETMAKNESLFLNNYYGTFHTKILLSIRLLKFISLYFTGNKSKEEIRILLRSF